MTHSTTQTGPRPDGPPEDPFLDEVRRLKREAAERTPTRAGLVERLREIERRRAGTMASPRRQTGAA